MEETQGMTCSEFSQQAGEQLFGTASQVETWFLLEVDARWEPEILNSEVPAPIKTWLTEQLAAAPNSRAQFIRQKPRLAPPGIHFFVVLSREASPAIYEFHLAGYDELLALDIAGMRTGSAVFEPFRRAAPLFLVCTHGRRDRCCAQRGVPVVDALAPLAGASIWQSSHVGGHRFGANLITFPHGIYYGHITPDNAGAILAAYDEGHLVPALYRGRSCYPGIVQAAEYFLRAETGITELDAFRLAGIVSEGDGTRVAFTAGGSAVHEVVLVVEQGLRVYSSCTDAEPGPVEQVRLAEFHRAG